MKQATQQLSTKDRLKKKLGGNDEEGGDDDEPLSDIVAGMRDPHIADMMVWQRRASTRQVALRARGLPGRRRTGPSGCSSTPTTRSRP